MSKKEESKVVVNTELLQEILQTIAEKNNDSLINKNVLTVNKQFLNRVTKL